MSQTTILACRKSRRHHERRTGRCEAWLLNGQTFHQLFTQLATAENAVPPHPTLRLFKSDD